MPPITIKLSLPHHSLSPNARVHWAAKTRRAKEQRKDAGYLALAATDCARPRWPKATLNIRAYCRKGKTWDRDNLISALKSAIDGVCEDAGLLVNDRHLTFGTVEIVDAVAAETYPHVVLEFCPW